MPSRRSRITPKEAELLERLARDASSKLGKRAPRGRYREFLETDVVKKAMEKGICPTTEQGLRLLRRSYSVFGPRMKSLLVELGFAKVVLLAKLRDAKKIVRSGKIQLADGDVKTLTELTKRELEGVLRNRPLKKGHRAGEPSVPGHVFRVPVDLEVMTADIIYRMKSLIPRRPTLRPRYRIEGPHRTDPERGEPDDQDRRLAHQRELLAVLAQVLGLLEEELRAIRMSSATSDRLVTEANAKRRRQVVRVKPGNLWDAIKRLSRLQAKDVGRAVR